MEFTASEILIGLFFFLASVLHTSLGFGGGSSYSAIQASFNYSSVFLKGNSLFCNTLASGYNIYKHVSEKQFHLKKAIIFTLPALPFTYWGSTIKTSENIYLLVLGLFLISSSCLKFFKPNISLSVLATLPISLFIGFVSGYVGIGGGILLAPFVVNKLSPRECTSVTSLFIFLNSITAFAGQLVIGYEIRPLTYFLLLAVLTGTFLGNYISFKQIFQLRLFQFLNLFLLLIGLLLIVRGTNFVFIV